MLHARQRCNALYKVFHANEVHVCGSKGVALTEAGIAPWDRTAALIKSGKLPDVSVEKCQKNYKKALEKGVLKILSKMGISLLSCYHGAQIFEIYGLGKEVVDFAFKGSVSRIGGMSLADLQREAESFWIKVQPLNRLAVSHFVFVSD